MPDRIVTTTFTTPKGTVGYYVEINDENVYGGFSNSYIKAYEKIVTFLENNESSK